MNECRFTIKQSHIVDDAFVIIDAESKYTFSAQKNMQSLMSTCKALNELWEDNETLEKKHQTDMVEWVHYIIRANKNEKKALQKIDQLSMENDDLSVRNKNAVSYIVDYLNDFDRGYLGVYDRDALREVFVKIKWFLEG